MSSKEKSGPSFRRLDMAAGSAGQLVSDIEQAIKASKDPLLTEVLTQTIGDARSVQQRLERYLQLTRSD